MQHDAEAVVRVNVRTWQSAYRGMVPDDVLDSLGDSMDEWSARTRDLWAGEPQRFHTAIAEFDGDVAGFVTYGPYRIDQNHKNLDATAGEVLALHVDPSAQGKGVGQLLMDAVVKELRLSGIDEVRLWVLRENAAARRFSRVVPF
jgi:ribosomal protein S18 acetylase RimI-like enzyme